MRINALYVGKTYTFTTKEPIAYAIPNMKELRGVDVVVVHDIGDGVKWFPDPQRGLLMSWEVRDRILIVSGIPKRATTIPIVRLDDVKVEYYLSAEEVTKALLQKGEEVVKKMESRETITDDDVHVKVGKITFRLIVTKPPADTSSLTDILVITHRNVTAGRKRVFLASPAIVEIQHEGEQRWYVVTIPTILHFIKENPEALVQVGIMDPDGFNAPYFIVRYMEPEDLGTIDKQRSNVDWLDRLLKTGIKFGFSIGPGGGIGAGEEAPPF